jgi:SPP1 family phage portal protein
MAQGVNYYDSKHDILDHLNRYWVDGTQREDKVKSNYRIPHPFHHLLVDQKMAYVVGNPVVVSVAEIDAEDPKNPTPKEEALKAESDKFEEMIHDYLDNDFDDLLGDWVVGASKKGLEWVHFYISPSGELEYCIIPAEQVIPVYDTQYQKKLQYIVRYYVIDWVNDKGEISQRYKVEWWSDKEVEYFSENAEGNFVHDPDYEFNPGPHWFSFNTATPTEKMSNEWGRVPFVPLLNNSQMHDDLRPVKALIDAYDKVKSGWINDLADFQELLYVVKGLANTTEEAREGYTELGYFVQNLKTNKVAAVDADGDLTTLKAEIPVEAKEKFLAITRKEIFYFGQGVDIDDENLGSASGVALKFRYSGLDLKAMRLIRKLKKALGEFMWFVVDYLNKKNNTSYDYEELIYTVNKSQVFNETERIASAVASKGLISDKTILEHHPWIDDVEEEEKRLESEAADRAARAPQLQPGVPANLDADMPPDGSMPPDEKDVE